MNRRNLIHGILLAMPAWILMPDREASANNPTGNLTRAMIDEMRSNWRRLMASDADYPEPSDPFSRNEQQWRQQLDPERYAVLRENDTEPAGSSPLNAESRPGLYLCAGCSLPVFSSEMKYDSETGWPSFFTTIPGVFQTRLDFSAILPRTEYHCVRCGSHHGHLFDDGPAPTHDRWCNNGLALRFVPAAS